MADKPSQKSNKSKSIQSRRYVHECSGGLEVAWLSWWAVDEDALDIRLEKGLILGTNLGPALTNYEQESL